MKKLLIMALSALAFAAAAQAQPMARSPQPTVNRPPAPHTGDWWKDKSGVFREAYVGGYKEGAHNALGHDTELSKFAAKDLVAGINKFYEDFRNRNIQFPQVINYVADQLRGIP